MKEYSELDKEIVSPEELETQKMKRSCWYRLSLFLTKYPNNYMVVLLIYVCVIPLAMVALEFNISSAIGLVVGKTDKSWIAMQKIGEAFGLGVLAPYEVLMVGDVNTEQFFEQGEVLCKTLAENVDYVEEDYLESIFENWDYDCKDHKCQYLNYTAAQHKAATDQEYFTWLYKQVDEKSESTLVVLIPDRSPYEDSKNIIKDMRNALDLMDNTYKNQTFEYYLYGANVVMQDTIDHTFALFPRQIWVTCLLAFTIMALLLWSVFVPLRLALTLVIP
eukprot:UN30618